MESKVKDNLAVIIFVVLIVAVGLFSVRLALGSIYADPKAPVVKKAETGIDQKKYETIAKPQGNDSTISLESGFGRENPFAPYK